MARPARPVTLTPDQQAEADRIYAALTAAAEADIRALADQLATTTDATVFGANEFTLRDIVHRVAAKGIEIALEGRKKATPANVTWSVSLRDLAGMHRGRVGSVFAGRGGGGGGGA